MTTSTMFNNLFLSTILVALLAASPFLRAECKAGAYTIYSGDTMEYQGERFRLKGVKAPAPGEPLAEASEKALQTLVVLNCPVKCFVSDRNDEGEALVVCYGGDEEEINATMVREGYAAADPAYPEYKTLEQEAKKEKRGIWSDDPMRSEWSWPKPQDDTPPESITEPASSPAGSNSATETSRSE